MTTTTDKRAIGAGWTGKPDTDTYRAFLQKADPERVAREERERVVADLMQRASYGYDEWQAAEVAGNEKRAGKFAVMYFLRLTQLDYLHTAPLVTWCSACQDPSEPRQEGQQSRLDGQDEESHLTCLEHMELLHREIAEQRATEALTD